MDIVLIAGLWLDGSAWDDVVPALEALGHRPVRSTSRSGRRICVRHARDQVAAVLTAIDSSPEKPMVVGHSAACTWLGWPPTRDRRRWPKSLSSALPSADGSPTPTSSSRRTLMPFPGGVHSRAGLC